jgi:hypothetical protein
LRIKEAGTVELSAATFGFDNKSPFWQLLAPSAITAMDKKAILKFIFIQFFYCYQIV